MKKYIIIIVVIFLLLVGENFFSKQSITNVNVATILNFEIKPLLKIESKAILKSDNKKIRKLENEKIAIKKPVIKEIPDDFKDSDKDGLSDFVEYNLSHTDYKNSDTDNDGLLDGWELDCNLNPLKKDSFGDGINDNERQFDYEIVEDKVVVNLTGNANIKGSNLDVIDYEDGYLDKAFLLSSDTSKIEGTIKVKLNSRAISAQNLEFFHIDEKGIITPISTFLNESKSEIVGKITDLGMYFIGDKNSLKKDVYTNIAFLIDNSSSMNADIHDKRINFPLKIINELEGYFRYSVATFHQEYSKLLNFSKDKSTVKDTLNKIKSLPKVDNTNILGAILEGLKQFNSFYNDNYLVVFTDGLDNISNNDELINDIASIALDKNVKICSYNVMNNENSYLNKLMQMTGCDNYSNEFDLLKKLQSKSKYVDVDNDNIVDGLTILDSNFVRGRDNFSFYSFYSDNALNNLGTALFTKLYFQNELPLKMNEGKLAGKRIPGYDLTGTYFANKYNLYDYKIHNSALNFLLSECYNYIFYSQKEKQILNNIGVNIIKEEGYEIASINVFSPLLEKNVSVTELNLIKAITRFNSYTSYELCNSYKEGDKVFKYLKESFKENKTVLIKINKYYQIVNGINLIQDINNPNHFMIGVNDDNIIDKEMYIDLIRTKISLWEQLKRIKNGFEENFNKYKYDFSYPLYYDEVNEGASIDIYKLK